MTVRFASFNVENLFARPKALNLLTWEAGQPILDAYAEFNSLIALADYTAAIKARMIQLLLLVEVYRLDGVTVRRNRTLTRNGRGCERTAVRSTSSVKRRASRSSPTTAATGSGGWSSRPTPSTKPPSR